MTLFARHSLSRILLKFFFPQRCLLCRDDLPEDQRALCPKCRMDFPQWEGLSCEVCDVPLPDGGQNCWYCRRNPRAFRFCRSAGLFDEGLRKSILLFKYGRRDALAHPLGLFLAEAFFRHEFLAEAQMLVPVPLHFIKRRARGFNQSELLARFLGEKTGLSVCVEALVRNRWTRAQAKLGRDQRAGNVSSAFRVRQPHLIEGKKVLLIDDVCTTGATLEACAQALNAAGALCVDALTLARDPLKSMK